MLVTNLSMKLSFFLPIEKREFVEISHVVSCDDFVIFVSYDFRGEIQQFICDIIGEAKKNNLYRHGWKVCRLIEETKNFVLSFC